MQTDTLELLDLKELEAMRERSEDGQVPLPGSEHPSPTPKATEARKNSNDKQHGATAKAPQRREASSIYVSNVTDMRFGFKTQRPSTSRSMLLGTKPEPRVW